MLILGISRPGLKGFSCDFKWVRSIRSSSPDKFKAVRNSFQYLFGYSPKLFEQHQQQQQQNILVHLDKLVGISALLSHGHLCFLLLLFHNDGGIRRSFWLKTCHVFHQTSLFVPLLRKGLDLLSHCVQHVFLQFYTSWSPLRQIWSAADNK